MALLGPVPKREPPGLTHFKETLGSRLVHAGWCPKPLYLEWLHRAKLTISTARHEFFGIAMLEAAAHGIFPLLPRALSYPEVIPCELFADCYYDDASDLVNKAVKVLAAPPGSGPGGRSLQEAAYRFDWRTVACTYDDGLGSVHKGFEGAGGATRGLF